MAGIDRTIKHYRVNYDTGERTLNTDFNILIILNALAYIVNLVLIFTVGAFGGVSNTTQLLSYSFQSLVTTEEIFFKLAWGIIIPWQGFWVCWQIIKPSERNCEGVVRAAYFYPFATCLYAGYTISCRAGMMILATVFVWGLCGTMIGLAMSMQRYTNKIWKGYLLWQAPLTLHAAWIMVETMLMTNLLFLRLDETWIIKIIIAGISILVIFTTAIAWLSSYPVDFSVPFVLMCAVGGIYLELKNENHYYNLSRQDYSPEWIEGWSYAVLAVFVLILLGFIIKAAIVLINQRPKQQKERETEQNNRVSVQITINRGDDDNKNENNNNQSVDTESDDYESPPSTPVRKPKKKSSKKGTNISINLDNTDPRSIASKSPRPKGSKKKSARSAGPKSGSMTSRTESSNFDYDIESPKPKKKRSSNKKKKSRRNSDENV